MRYLSFIHQESDSFGVSFPDFPGCISVGESLDDAIHNACEALSFYVECSMQDGDDIPAPRSMTEIVNDPELADWRKGAQLVWIPLLLDRGVSKRVNISVDLGLLDAIDGEAKRRRVTRSAFLATAARNELEAT